MSRRFNRARRVAPFKARTRPRTPRHKAATCRRTPNHNVLIRNTGLMVSPRLASAMAWLISTKS
jgi:hypothetical protein